MSERENDPRPNLQPMLTIDNPGALKAFGELLPAEPPHLVPPTVEHPVPHYTSAKPIRIDGWPKSKGGKKPPQGGAGA